MFTYESLWKFCGIYVYVWDSFRVLRYICGCLQRSVSAKWPSDESVRTRVVRSVFSVSFLQKPRRLSKMWFLNFCSSCMKCILITDCYFCIVNRTLIYSYSFCCIYSGFIFLRLLCPAILNPKSFNLITGMVYFLF